MSVSVRIDDGVAADVAKEVRRAVAGFRLLSAAPHRVEVRVVPHASIMAPDGVICFGLFEEPDSPAATWPRRRKLRICVAGRVVKDDAPRHWWVKRVGLTVLHELAHYERWRDGRPHTERGIEVRAAAMRRLGLKALRGVAHASDSRLVGAVDAPIDIQTGVRMTKRKRTSSATTKAVGRLSPADRLRQLILFKATGQRPSTAEAIEAAWGEKAGSCELGDAMSELRGGSCRTGLPCDSSRHYESEAVAAKMLDGSWVGWTYWFGGGKHGEPEGLPWVDEAYGVAATETVAVTRVFQREGEAAEPPPPLTEEWVDDLTAADGWKKSSAYGNTIWCYYVGLDSFPRVTITNRQAAEDPRAAWSLTVVTDGWHFKGLDLNRETVAALLGLARVPVEAAVKEFSS